ncbi:MAG: type II toxin-antitoxin system HigB family toxin [Nitrosomonas sp.]|nr:type II toxin-antitoxin system HigB family toxin [Nitrosomonas sp.]
MRKSQYGTIIGAMRVVALSTLKVFRENHPAYSDAMQPVLVWYRHTLKLKADWASPSAAKQDFKNAGIIKDGRVILNIAGNKHRLVVWINYAYRVVYIRFIGTHAQYDLRASLEIQILSQYFVARAAFCSFSGLKL